MPKYHPAVFAVHNEYQIMIRVDFDALMWVKIGDRCFYDDSNGILRSATRIHRITVPAELLNKEKAYTICLRKIIERKPYYSETSDITELCYEFIPAEKETLRAYHIADAHNAVETPVSACNAFGEIDFLILNGDIPDSSNSLEAFDNIYEICSKITNGKLPIVFSRGNHDTRGVCAERFSDYTPVDNGKSYFTFRLGKVWGIVLDCGEDKADTSSEYGNTICCHNFRLKETEFLKEVIRNAENEYLADGISHRVVVSHIPFSRVTKPPFDIEQDIYSEWCSLLKENIKPNVMICGHVHQLLIDRPGCEHDNLGQPCCVVCASQIDYKTLHYAGGGFVFSPDGIEVTFTDSDKNILHKEKI